MDLLSGLSLSEVQAEEEIYAEDAKLTASHADWSRSVTQHLRDGSEEIIGEASEKQVIDQIDVLWAQHKSQKIHAKKSRVEQAATRALLASSLSVLKERYVKTGRDGQWASTLRRLGVPLSTADRLVKRHQLPKLVATQGEQTKRSTDSKVDPVSGLVQSVTARVHRSLKSADLIQRFLTELIDSLS